jgi:hypothetical protein
MAGVIARRGVFGPVTPDTYGPVLRELHALGIRCTETIEDA